MDLEDSNMIDLMVEACLGKAYLTKVMKEQCVLLKNVEMRDKNG